MKSIEQPALPGWGWALSHDPVALCSLVEHGKARLWVEALVRAADERLQGALGIPTSSRGVAPRWLPGGVVPVVGARTTTEGALGVLRFDHASGLSVSSLLHPPSDAGGVLDSSESIELGIALAFEPLLEFMPEAIQPSVELDLVGLPAGDSMALPAAIGAVLRSFGCAWPSNLIATGGLSRDHRQFAPVPQDTLAIKARSARAWGFRRIALVVDPDDTRTVVEGLEVVRLPREPAALPLALASLAGVELSEERIACALSIFDLRIGRSGPNVHDRVLEVTEPMLKIDSPIVRHIALDMRSRIQLHAGRTRDARQSLEQADSLRGRGSLPDGRLRDVLRYQQPAHRSIVHVDLAEWGDDLPAHREVDRCIRELDSLWSTRHERLMRFFLANTRARRQEYLGRLHSDPIRFDRAWSDLLHYHEHWDELIDSFAVRELRLADTNRARIENQIIDVAYSRYQLEGSIPQAWSDVVSGFCCRETARIVNSRDSVLHFEQARGEELRLGGNGFDLLSRFKRHRVLELPGQLDEVARALECDHCRIRGHLPYPWFHWLELVGLEAQRVGGRLPLPGEGDSRLLQQAWGFVLSDPQGIGAAIGLRSRHGLSQLGHELPPGGSPAPDTAIRALCVELASDSGTVLRRAPY